MENSIMSSWGLDPAYIIIGLSALVLILMILVIVCIVKMRKLYRRYDYFMRGKDAESLEDIILDQIGLIQNISIIRFIIIRSVMSNLKKRSFKISTSNLSMIKMLRNLLMVSGKSPQEQM